MTVEHKLPEEWLKLRHSKASWDCWWGDARDNDVLAITKSNEHVIRTKITPQKWSVQLLH